MTPGAAATKIVRVQIDEGKAGLFYATSPDLKGLLVAEPTIDELEREIPKAIIALYAACDVHVVVAKAQDSNDRFTPWVAMPVEVAAKALTETGIIT